MTLSLEVKGVLAQLMSEIFSWDKLQILAMRVGVDLKDIEEQIEQQKITKTSVARYIVKRLPIDREDLAIKTVFQMSKKGRWDQDESEEVVKKLNPIMESTMQCRIDEEGNIIPIFDSTLEIIEKQTYIEKELKDLGFNKTLTNYRDAIKTYKTSYKGSISLLRSTFEALVDEIIQSKGETLKSNQKDKLAQLKKLGFLKEIEKDNEFEYAYRIFGLLSHYGSHSDLITEEVANFLFSSTLAFIWFIVNRYEKERPA